MRLYIPNTAKPIVNSLFSPIFLNVLFIVLLFACPFTNVGAQYTAASNTIKKLNDSILALPCNTGSSMLITNRAMNVFLADKTGYVAEFGDLSYFTNYVTLNSTTGLLTLNHNFQKAEGVDEPLKRLFGVGIRANVGNGFNSLFTEKKHKNELGATITNTWLGKVKTRFAACKTSAGTNAATNHKWAMDALRTSLVNSLEIDYENSVRQHQQATGNTFKNTNGLSSAAANELVDSFFYEQLDEATFETFARRQAEILTNTNYFKVVKTHWTSLIGYVPLAFPRYLTAPSFTNQLIEKHPYPWEILLSHTRFWENSKAGKRFVTVGGRLTGGSTVNSFSAKTTFEDYKNLGGTDTLRFASFQYSDAYIGAYKRFITPSLRARIVYFSHDSHVGLSLLLEQHFGNYNPLNARLGIPVVLINSKKTPALNIEFQAGYFDVTNKISAAPKKNKVTIGVGIGLPISRLMF